MKKQITITNVSIPMRLDRYLRTLNDNLTQGVIEKALRNGLVKLNGKKAKSSVRVQSSDMLEVAEHLLKETTYDKNFSPSVITLAKKLFSEYLIEENEHFIAIDKPVGLPSQGGNHITVSVDHALQYINHTEQTELRIVHRLDRDTSGVLIIAKTREAAILLGNAFKDRVIEKRYIALLHGNVHEDSGRISSHLRKNHEVVENSNEEEGKEAVTNYRVLKRERSQTLVEFTPHTGRMHQLRCHAAFELKCPIVGDRKYGISDTHAKRLMLHACQIRIPSSVFGVEYHVRVKEGW